MLYLNTWKTEPERPMFISKIRMANEPRRSLLSHRPVVVIPLQCLFLLVQLYEVTALPFGFPLCGLAFRCRQLPAEVTQLPKYVLSNFCWKSIMSHPSMLVMHKNEVVHTIVVQVSSPPASQPLASVLSGCSLDRSSAKDQGLNNRDPALPLHLERQ